MKKLLFLVLLIPSFVFGDGITHRYFHDVQRYTSNALGIRSTTSDGADVFYFTVDGGSEHDPTGERGGFLSVHGNESANGQVNLFSGTNGGGIQIYDKSTTGYIWIGQGSNITWQWDPTTFNFTSTSYGGGVKFARSGGFYSLLNSTCQVISGTGATTQTWSSAIPAFSRVLGVVGYTTETYTSGGTITSIDYGITGTATEFANARPLTAGTTWFAPTAAAAGTLPKAFTSATNIVVTANGGGTITAGQTRICITYIDWGLPTS